MKSITSRVALMALLLSSTLCVGSTVNNEQREFQMVQAAFIQFINDTGQFPTSWDDLWDNPASRPSVEWLDQGKSFGRRTDMIESFRFVARGTTIILPQDGSRIIGMMTRPMRPPPDRKLRLLIVQLKDGTRRLKQIPEESLVKIFSSINLDLADYTGPNGNWAPETRLRPLSEIPPPPKWVSPDPSMDHSTIPSLPNKPRPRNSKDLANATAKNTTPFPWWVIASSLALLVMAIIASLKVRKANSNPSSNPTNYSDDPPPRG